MVDDAAAGATASQSWTEGQIYAAHAAGGLSRQVIGERLCAVHVMRLLRLDATDLPAPGFVQAFCASQQLSQALGADRHSSANGQAGISCAG